MNTKQKIILACSLILLICVMYFLFREGRGTENVPPVDSDPDGWSTPIRDISTSTIRVDTSTTSVSLPSTKTTITKELFERLKLRWNTFDFDGELIGTSTNDYSISYTKKFDLFQISVVNDPAEEVQKLAEDELIVALGIEKELLCGLQVDILWRTWSTDFEFENHQLSFCPGSGELD
jgi:hypothetical protein